jgi:hypothetical protein
MPTLDQLLFLAERNSWQDLALCAGNVFFCFTLVPMLRHPARPPLLTCIPTGIALLQEDSYSRVYTCGSRR